MKKSTILILSGVVLVTVFCAIYVTQFSTAAREKREYREWIQKEAEDRKERIKAMDKEREEDLKIAREIAEKARKNGKILYKNVQKY